MGTRLYESELDRERERSFILKIERKFKCRCSKLPHHLAMDVLISRGDYAVAWGELKCRNVSSTTYPTLVIGEQKLKKGLGLQKLFGHAATNENLPIMLFVRFSDKDMWVKVPHLEGARRERLIAKNHAEDPLDTEWVVHLPLSKFTQF